MGALAGEHPRLRSLIQVLFILLAMQNLCSLKIFFYDFFVVVLSLWSLKLTNNTSLKTFYFLGSLFWLFRLFVAQTYSWYHLLIVRIVHSKDISVTFQLLHSRALVVRVWCTGRILLLTPLVSFPARTPHPHCTPDTSALYPLHSKCKKCEFGLWTEFRAEFLMRFGASSPVYVFDV